MEHDKYLKLFIDEANEYIQLMNDCIVALEKNPSDASVLFQLYRGAHSIKGMAATMQFDSLRDLAHALEDIFELLRKEEIHFDNSLSALLFEGIDSLKKGIEKAVKKEKMPRFTSYINTIKSVARQREAGGRDKNIVKKEKAVAETEALTVEVQQAEYAFAYKIEVQLSGDSAFPAARAMVIYNKLGSAGKIVNSNPTIDEITGGKPCYFMIIEYLTDLQKTEIESMVSDITDIQSFNVALVKMETEEKENGLPSSIEMHTLDSTFKIDTNMLDTIYNTVTELFILNEEFQEYKDKFPIELLKTSTDFNLLITQLYDDISKVRLLPVGAALSKIPRMIRDLSKKQKKKIKFLTKGEDILIDKAILEHLIDPFVHIIRNSIDHGIEEPEERSQSGKDEEGIISVIAARESGNLKIVLVDDGRGINLKKIKEEAVKRGFISEQKAMQMSPDEVLLLITLPGFSTAPAINDVSGRGFGMDIVKSRIESLGGTIKLETKARAGTKITLYIPLLISISDSFIVSSNGFYFAVPMSHISKAFTIARDEIQYIQSEPFVIVDSKRASLEFLSHIFELANDEEKEKYFVLLVESAEDLKGVIVDEIVEQRRVIIKPLHSPLELLPYYQGIAILSKEKILPVIDINKLLIRG